MKLRKWKTIRNTNTRYINIDRRYEQTCTRRGRCFGCPFCSHDHPSHTPRYPAPMESRPQTHCCNSIYSRSEHKTGTIGRPRGTGIRLQQTRSSLLGSAAVAWGRGKSTRCSRYCLVALCSPATGQRTTRTMATCGRFARHSKSNA